MRLFGEVYGTRDAQAPSATSFRAVDKTVAGTVGIAGRVETGLTYTLSGGLTRRQLDDPFSTVYDDATTTAVRAEIVQPLWRGAFSAARKPIVVASLRRDRSEQELRARIETTIGTVQVAYWNLVRARSERDARVSAIELAKEQLEDAKRLRRLGTGSDLDVVEAEVGVSRRQQELLRTEQDVVEADGRLFSAIGVRAGEPGWGGVPLEPTDTAQIEPVALDVAAQIALARARRSDVLAARDLIAAESAELAVTGDQRRASLDLVAAAGTVGFAGSLATTYATQDIRTGALMPPYTPDADYDGGLGRSLRNTIGTDLQLFVGLRFEVPLGNHAAAIRHSIQERAVSRARLAEHATLARIESEVRTTVARVGVSVKLVEAADQTVALSEKLLEGMRKRYRSGASTSFDVLRASEELTRARVEAARARADYRGSLTQLAAATGTLLESSGVTVQRLGASPR